MFIDHVPAKCREWKLRIGNLQRKVILIREDQPQVILGTLPEEIGHSCWMVYRNSAGDHVLVAGDVNGRMNWFTVEM